MSARRAVTRRVVDSALRVVGIALEGAPLTRMTTLGMARALATTRTIRERALTSERKVLAETGAMGSCRGFAAGRGRGGVRKTPAGALGFSTDKSEGEATTEEEAKEGEGDAEGGDDEEDELTRLRGELEEKDAKVADLTDRVLRTMAEMENLRERTRRQAEDAKKFAIQGFCKDLLDVADNLDRAIATVTEDDAEADLEATKAKLKSFHEGVVMTEKQLASVFNKNGVTKFNPEGEEFDANAHMALFNVPIPEGSDAKPGTIAAVTKTGYSLHERVIRAAEVGVYQ